MRYTNLIVGACLATFGYAIPMAHDNDLTEAREAAESKAIDFNELPLEVINKISEVIGSTLPEGPTTADVETRQLGEGLGGKGLADLVDVDKLSDTVGMTSDLLAGPAKSVNGMIDGIGEVAAGGSSALKGIEQVAGSAKGLMGSEGGLP